MGHAQPSNPSETPSVTIPDRSVTIPDSAVTFPDQTVTIVRNTHLPTEVIHLVGPDALTGPGIAKIWSGLMNKPVAYTGSDTRSFEARLAHHAPGWMAMDMRLMLDRFCSDGMAATATDVDKMTQLLGRSPRSYADFAAETLAQWQA